jgi:hypothetical protein
VLGGDLVETGQGTVVVVRTEYPLGHRHGRACLAGIGEVPDAILGLLARPDGGPPGSLRPLFLDAETTGLAGGTGTYAFLVGAGWVESDRLVVAQYFMRDFDDEPALLAALRPLLEQASVVVTYNGTGFDLPLLETRFVLGRARWPALPHVDLLWPARRVWSRRLADCRLATLERDVLGVTREADVAGWEIPTRYFEYLRRRDAVPLVPVLAHNRHDVLSLVALLGWFATALDGAAREQLSADELAGVGRLLEPVDVERSLEYFRAALDAGLDGPAAHAVRLCVARWEKRRARWAAACALWEASTRIEMFDPRPWEELAKYHEHRSRDLAAAHGIVASALALARQSRVPAHVLETLAYRLARLERRLSTSR